MNPHHAEEQESVKAPAQPKLCAAGCGFFANPACSDLCSKCFRDAQQTNDAAKVMATEVAANIQAAQQGESKPATAAQAAAQFSALPAETSSAAAAAVPPVAAAPEDDRPKQKNTNRCFECNKKVGLTGFTCRCGYVYCGSHRYAEAHKCTFDYKAQGRERLATNNPQVVASKVAKI